MKKHLEDESLVLDESSLLESQEQGSGTSAITVDKRIIEELELMRLFEAIVPFGQLDGFDLNSLRGLTIAQALIKYPKLMSVMKGVVEKVSMIIADALKDPDLIKQEREYQICIENAELLKMMGELFMTNGYFDQALEAFHGAEQILKDDGELYWYMGEIYFYHSTYEIAVDFYKEALEFCGTKDEKTETLKRIAETLVKLADTQKSDRSAAHRIYHEALQYVPHYSPAYCGLAWISLFNNDVKMAEAYFELAKNIDPNNEEAATGLAECAELKKERIVETPSSLNFYYSLSRMAESQEFTFSDYLKSFKKRQVNNNDLS